MLTHRGWALLAAAATLVAAGSTVGIEELFPLAATACLMLVGSVLWTRSRRWDLEAWRRIYPQRVPMGGHARVNMAIRNRHARRSPVFVVHDRSSGGNGLARFALAPLQPGDEVHSSYYIPGRQRGVFSVGPLEVELSDPLGVARRTRRIGSPSRLVVYPRVESLTTFTLAAGADRQSVAGAAVVGTRGEEFYAVREYVTGDDIRSVHWPSTARHDDLMIRQQETVREGRMTLAVDVREAAHDRLSLEASLSAVASLADAALRSGNHIRMVTTGGDDSGWGSGGAHRAKVLDLLATLRTHPPSAGQRPDLGTGSVVAVTTDSLDREGLADLGLASVGLPGSRGAVRRRLTVVVIERAEAPGATQRTFLPGAKVVTVGPGQTLAAAWAHTQRVAW